MPPTSRDIFKLRKNVELIKADQTISVSAIEASKYFVESPETLNPLLGKCLWAMFGRRRGTFKLCKLTIERTTVVYLLDLFGISTAFNDKLFWLFVHVWLLHRRMLIFDDVVQEEDFFRELFSMVDRWIMFKTEIPKYRVSVESSHAQKHALGFCVALDLVFDKPSDIMPSELLNTLHVAFSSTHPIPIDDVRILNLAKYIIRQDSYLAHIPRSSFLKGDFQWIKFPATSKKTP